jgi:hypothetical protein
MASSSDRAGTVRRLIGVYNADGGVRGELTYVVGHLRGTTSCSLCDITHRGVRRRRSWDVFCQGLGVPFDLVHRNERTPELLAFTAARTPTVVAELVDGALVEVLDAAALAAVDGDVDGFGRALSGALDDKGLEGP